MASQKVMLSPMPCKSLRSLPTSPCTASEMDFDQLFTPRPFWHNVADDATPDALELLSCQQPTEAVPDWMPAFDAAFGARSTLGASAPFSLCTSPPPPSQASTCFMSPPLRSCDRISEPWSPSSPPDLDLNEPPMSLSPPPALVEKPQRPPGALDKMSWLQARKVFIGGIPQSIDQNGLYQMFSKVGKVKKAWLQLFRDDRAPTQTIPTTKKHRGFGFVIFYEKSSIDQMLGNESSRFVNFGNDLKLEVKRAFGKTKGPEEVFPFGKENKRPPVNVIAASPAPPKTYQSSPCAPTSASPAPQTPQVGSWAPSSMSPTAQTCQSGSWMPSSMSPAPQPYQNWQGLTGQAVVVLTFPYVPPFPSAEPGMVQQTSDIIRQPLGNHPQWPLNPGAALNGFAGQNQELTKALIDAMPDCYED